MEGTKRTEVMSNPLSAPTVENSVPKIKPSSASISEILLMHPPKRISKRTRLSKPT